MSKIKVRPNVVNAPTIFVGLGGAGGQILSRVAKMCQEHEDDTRNVEFVCLDTNANDLSTIKKEGVQIRYVQTSNTQTVGDYLDYDTDARRNWFPKNAVMYDKTVSEGAGQVRAISRLALNATIKTGRIAPLYDAIDDLFRKNGEDLKQALRVVLVCTSSGGTGSGIVLPISMMIREYVKMKYPNTALLTRGLILLPETLDSVIGSTQERESQRRNAYATIKEINAFMMKGSGFFEIDEDLKRYKNMHVDYVAADGTKKSLSLLPMDFCFLMDGQDAEDSTMIDYEQYKDMAALALYEQNIGPMQKSAFSVEDNIIKELSVPGNLGRNRFGGIGASVLRYPYEDVADYVAYGWALENFGRDGASGKWGQYDRAFEQSDAEAKKKGVPISERPTRADIYISSIDTGEDPFSKDIKNLYQLKSTESRITQFNAELSAHIQGILEENATVKGYKTAVDALTKPIDYSMDKNKGKATKNLNSLRNYEKCMKVYMDMIAESEANAVFSNETPTIDEKRRYTVEHLLKTGDEIAHPVAARYILYRLRDRMAKRRDELKTELDGMTEDMRQFSPAANNRGFDLEYTEGKVEMSLDAVCAAEGKAEIPQGMFKKYNGNTVYDILNVWFPKYYNAVNELSAVKLEYEVYNKGVEFLNDACEEYEKFFASFKGKVAELLRRREDLVESLKYKKGNSIRNVCADRECLEELALMTAKQSSQSAMLDKELNGQIFDAIKENVAFERMLRYVDVAEDDTRQDIFEKTLLEYFRQGVRKNCENLDVNIVKAIALEYRLKERNKARKEMEYSREAGGQQSAMVDHVDREKTDHHVMNTIAVAMRLAAPSIQRINNEEPREVRCTAYHVSLDSMRDYTMSQLFGKGVSAVPCDTVSPYELHFFDALYNLTPDKLNKFASPMVAETRVKNAGLYQNAYMAYAKHLGPDSTKNMMISTHIDKRWDSIAFMPEIDMVYMGRQMMKIHQSLIYALIYNAIQYRNLSAAAGGKMVYRYENSDERTLDLIVSNGTLCDEFYEVLDALYIDASVVEDIEKLKAKRTERDLLRNSNYEKTLFAKAVAEFELPASIHEGHASLFEIPLGYYNSLPNSQRFSGEIAGLVSAVVQTLREEIECYENPDDVKFILCDVLKEQFTLLMENYDKHHINKPASDNVVIDLVYRKIRSVLSETPEPDDYESILDEIKSMIR